MEGPINGLYCVFNGSGHFVIWNPRTEEVGILPSPVEFLPGAETIVNYPRCYKNTIWGGVIGFGTDPLNEEDYKVVLNCGYVTENLETFVCSMLYTTNTNTWRVLENDFLSKFKRLGSWNSDNTYLNGIYYWLTWVDESNVVLAFDMGKKENFQQITTPFCSKDVNCTLALHNDHISYFSVNQSLCEIDVWILMVKESTWIKKFSVVDGPQGMVKSLRFWKKEDELLLVIKDYKDVGSQTILYNTTTREITKLGLRGFAPTFKSSVYYESLVSLTGGITKYKGKNASELSEIGVPGAPKKLVNVVE